MQGVEDDTILRDDLRTLLEREGFAVLAGARDGVESSSSPASAART